LLEHKRNYYFESAKKNDKVRESQKKYYQKNVDKIKASINEYYKLNINKIKESKKEYRMNNQVKIKDTKKEYYKNNLNKIKEIQKEYYSKNLDKIKNSNKDVQKNNPNYIPYYSWRSREESRKNFESIALLLHIKDFSDWYRISSNQIHQLGGIIFSSFFEKYVIIQ
jgi:hypothetical protein